MREESSSRYWIESVSKAVDLLDALEGEDNGLTLSELALRGKLSRSSAFRLLYTLERKKRVDRVDGGRKYRLLNRGQRYRIGYAMLSSQFAFSQDLTRSLREAASERGIELIVADNCFNGEIAVMNARMFVEKKVDLVVQSQAVERVAPLISHILSGAGIPCLAIAIPHPGAVYFGPNNFEAGILAGRALGEYTRDHWDGRVDNVLLLEVPDAGPLPEERITGALVGLTEVLGSLRESDAIHLDCRGTFQYSYRIVLDVLKSMPENTRLLVAAVNDPSAVAAARAMEACGRDLRLAIVGQGGSREGRAEMRKPDSPLLGSVAYFPEKFGTQIIPLALNILAGKPVSPAVYVNHMFLSRENVDHFYPNDLAPPADECSVPDLSAYPPAVVPVMCL